ncbi:hypothetical protein [Mesorhizobium sp.]|uniref:hypothetical protein n=1 Tax=Mesorhizobium sp. TaxID=1871066 RepID=UPI000FE8CC79|nr:hypothetical protein [Mesorhizobium sp.]RWM27790.1 MAG: hypothetical protein EOR74_11435 [Mesorhizobium sp.]RWM39963.1 MAG: hypothetical protein EOR75_12350 [Mesorhizobium sp.]TJV53186.1 MAG: hypothetical protein E5Y01_08295 [Mesorhizobium sp.]
MPDQEKFEIVSGRELDKRTDNEKMADNAWNYMKRNNVKKRKAILTVAGGEKSKLSTIFRLIRKRHSITK